MLTVYIDHKDIGQLPAPAAPGAVSEMRVELLDMPMTAAFRNAGDRLSISAYVRHPEAGAEQLRGSAVYSFATGVMSDVQGYAPLLELLQIAYIKLSALLEGQDGDVIAGVQEGRPVFRRVSGADRPDLLCADPSDATGKARVTARPYADERSGELSVPASLEYAQSLLSGDGHPVSDPQRAAGMVRELAQNGHTDAQLTLAAYCVIGCGAERDLAEAARWAQEAAKTGAQEAAALISMVQALPLLERKAAAGDAKSQSALASHYVALAPWVPGAEQTVLQPALAWALKAAAQQEPTGFHALGVCYAKGYGTAPDAARAAAAFQRAKETSQVPDPDAPSQRARAAAARSVSPAATADSPDSDASSRAELSAYRKAYGQWKRAIATARERRHPKIAKALQTIQSEIERAAKQEFEDATAPFDSRLAELRDKKAEADAALAATGIFQRAERKERKEIADRITSELDALEAEMHDARSRMEVRVSGAQREALRSLPDIMAAVDEEIPLPQAPDNPGGLTPVPGIDNYADLREATLAVLAESMRPLTIREMRTRSELIDERPDDAYRICRDLCDEGSAVGAQKNGTNTYALSEDGRWEVQAAQGSGTQEDS